MQAFFAEKNSIKADGIAARGPATAAKLNAFGIQTGLDLRSQSLALQAMSCAYWSGALASKIRFGARHASTLH